MSFRFWRRIRIAPGMILTNRQESRFRRPQAAPKGAREPGTASVNVSRKVVWLAEGIENETPSTPLCCFTRPGPCMVSGPWTRRVCR
ncbi:hypothetical protein [Dissulfurimicrobium hydrothermale]|uniref:hypothetical protein n=1 Tax=Dissulfurimicrobium hydrothermale TaxID=1750598 RepID=UPI001EDB8278|nr:hypothetical protein [Dissulfurimicrobium hydrothermale]UKL13962.1 hypothetical protein LGS26_01500 [Dissulfurimicrobium hydrothermale]